MFRIASLRPLGAVTLMLTFAVACAKPDAAPGIQKAAASGGEVAAKPAAASGMSGGLTDSISTQADRGRIRGAENAPVWLIEISDFQCPYCKQFHDQTFGTLDKEYVQTGKVRLAYLNYPIQSLHPNARAAAEAAMCASVQGKFWELHESLFISQNTWAPRPDPMPVFDSLSKAAGVNLIAWRNCIATHGSVALIDADHDRSKATGVESTPTFYVMLGSTMEKMIKGAFPADTFRVAIDKALAKARAGR